MEYCNLGPLHHYIAERRFFKQMDMRGDWESDGAEGERVGLVLHWHGWVKFAVVDGDPPCFLFFLLPLFPPSSRFIPLTCMLRPSEDRYPEHGRLAPRANHAH